MQPVKNSKISFVWFLCLILFAPAFIGTGCSGGGSGNPISDVADVFNTRNVNLYSEVPLIEIQGNRIVRTPPKGKSFSENRIFVPRSPLRSEKFDSDNDGIVDTYINDFDSLANAANNLLDIEIAACLVKAGGGNKHEGYLPDAAWARVGELAAGLAMDLEWQRRDVALVDNRVVLHGRRHFEGTRRVLASLVAPDAGDEPWSEPDVSREANAG